MFNLWPFRRYRLSYGERTIIQQIGTIMSKIDELKVAVENQGTVIDSAVALLGTLSQQLQDALDNDDQDELQSIIDGLNDQRNELAQAVTANTPVAGSPGEGTVPPASDVIAPEDHPDGSVDDAEKPG